MPNKFSKSNRPIFAELSLAFAGTMAVITGLQPIFTGLSLFFTGLSMGMAEFIWVNFARKEAKFHFEHKIIYSSLLRTNQTTSLRTAFKSFLIMHQRAACTLL